MHKNEWIRIERVGSGFRVSTVEGEEESEVFETKKSLLKFIDKHFVEKRTISYREAINLVEQEGTLTNVDPGRASEDR
jgi:hypothetical protein